MKDLGRIRRLFYRDGLSLSEISRETGYSRNTVKRWLRTPEGTEPKYERQKPKRRMADFSITFCFSERFLGFAGQGLRSLGERSMIPLICGAAGDGV